MRITATQLITLFVLLTSINLQAQFRVPVTNNDLRNNLQKVIAAFPEQFKGLKGDTLEDNPQTIEYSSLLDFQGAIDNYFIQYKSNRPVYSWKANLLSTEEFDVAAQKYKWLCSQLKVMTIKLDNGYSFTLNGHYDKPDESLTFRSSIYKMVPNASNMPKLRIEASMQFEFPEWKVSLLVYEKEKEDADRADVIEE